MAKRELIKVVATAVLLERDDDGQVTGELTSEPVAAYSQEGLAAVYVQAQVDVQAWNEAQPPPPNRAERRSRK